jgi:hypothetical protein
VSLIEKFIRGLKPRPNPAAKQAMTPWGPVSEATRLSVAYQIVEDPVTRAKVLDFLEKQLGSPEAALAEAKARWPEAFL